MKRYYGIEFLRFISSLSIVIYHWGTSFSPLNLNENYIYNNFLSLIYLYGDTAVSIFFVISGIVFSNIYLNKKNISFRNFFIKRFARL